MSLSFVILQQEFDTESEYVLADDVKYDTREAALAQAKRLRQFELKAWARCADKFFVAQILEEA